MEGRVPDERLREFAECILLLDCKDWSMDVEAAIEIPKELLKEARRWKFSTRTGR